MEKLLAFGGVDLKVGDDDDDDEHEEEEKYDEDVLWASRLAMASKKLRATDTHDTQMMMMLSPR